MIITFEELKLIFAPRLIKFDDFYVSEGLPKRKEIKLCYHSPYLKIYNYPSELDYTDLRPNPPTRLIGFLSLSSHRFIVSKGSFGDEYELPDNFWGENFVLQTAVLKIADLAIIHGGNNSLCETFYYGKPMIVMPLSADQYDNAQRVHEKGFEIRMNPFTCTKEQLLDAIIFYIPIGSSWNKLLKIVLYIENGKV